MCIRDRSSSLFPLLLCLFVPCSSSLSTPLLPCAATVLKPALPPVSALRAQAVGMSEEESRSCISTLQQRTLKQQMSYLEELRN
eukprot:790039-Pleurochrysis_carterae.AAC.1